MSLDNVVGTGTRQWTGQSKNHCKMPSRCKRFFSSPYHSD